MNNNHGKKYESEKYQTIFDSTPVPMHSSDLQGTIISVNEPWLRTFGYTVITTQNGNEAIEVLRNERNAGRNVAALILDLTIPGGMGGQEAIIEIRDIDKEIPVFVASGYSEKPVMAAPEAYGFTDSICKPFAIAELADLLRKNR
ncbi:MAG: response regulator [Chitinispirillaceae bacterium]|nr:response regulator [Chitinispirillaceae bacterium]